MGTYCCESARKIEMSKLDPCLAFGFLIRDYDEYLNFIEEVMPVAHDSGIFSVLTERVELHDSYLSL